MTNETFRLNSSSVDEFKSLETTSVALCICIIMFLFVGCAVYGRRKHRVR